VQRVIYTTKANPISEHPIRRARVRALAKINLDLRVLDKRPDGYHELRTIFQTISLADRLDLAFTPARATGIALHTAVDIPDNLAAKAARLCLDELHMTGSVELHLEKRIPMGAGLGGGSSDAAAVLLALPVLAGGVIPMQRLMAIARELGSDVPFFLMGGRAVGIGRGTELYPLPDAEARPALLVTPGIHVSTADAYRSLNRGQLTTELLQNNIDSFQAVVRDSVGVVGANDFEDAIFRKHPPLRALKHKLIKLGASSAMMSGSGSSIFGIFADRTDVSRAVKSFRKEAVFPISLIGRSRYRSHWRGWLSEHRIESEWPPRSRYAR
jgi:4-diphosphocytidyl-2-C-methyl-D-erythritol kinase